MTTTCRLAAILAADVAGYSRLIGADEEGTLERLKALRVASVLGDLRIQKRQRRQCGRCGISSCPPPSR